MVALRNNINNQGIPACFQVFFVTFDLPGASLKSIALQPQKSGLAEFAADVVPSISAEDFDGLAAFSLVTQNDLGAFICRLIQGECIIRYGLFITRQMLRALQLHCCAAVAG